VVWLRREQDVEWLGPAVDAGEVERMWRSAP
jgi:hypothetical protein